MKKQFTQETFDKMIDKVVFWNELAGNLPEDKSLEPVYLQLVREEMFGQNEFLQGWFTSDKVMQADGVADLIFTGGMLSCLQGDYRIFTDSELQSLETEEVIALLSSTLIEYGGIVNDSLYSLCFKMSEVMDVESVFNAVYSSNMTKYATDDELAGAYQDQFGFIESVDFAEWQCEQIEEQNRYSGVNYHKVGSYYIFTAKQDVQSGVVFDKPKIVKPSTFKEPIDLSQYIY